MYRASALLLIISTFLVSCVETAATPTPYQAQPTPTKVAFQTNTPRSNRQDATNEPVFQDLWEVYWSVFLEAPESYWEPKSEFETEDEYERRIEDQKRAYVAQADQYFAKVEERVFTIQKEPFLYNYESEQGRFPIYVELLGYSYPDGANKNFPFGPDIRLILPGGVEIEEHTYQTYYSRREKGTETELFFYSYVDSSLGERIRELDGQDNLLIKIFFQFNFPGGYEAFRFIDPVDYPIDYALEWKVEGHMIGAELVSRRGETLYSWGQDVTSQLKRSLTPNEAETYHPVEGCLASQLRVGDRAHVSFVPPYNNSVRSGSSYDASQVGLIAPGEQVKIVDGPVCDPDSKLWWKVEAPQQGLVGWTLEGDEEYFWIISDSDQ